MPKRRRGLLHPRQWHRWLGIGVLRAISLLPLPVIWACGMVLGELLYRLHRPRRHVASVNIEKCFPELPASEQRRLVRRHFHAFGQTVLDIGIAWWGSAARLRRLVHIRDRHYADQLLTAGRNVILLAPHFLGLELCGIRISLEGRGCAMFRRMHNEVLDEVMTRARTRFGLRLVAFNEPLTTLVKEVRAGTPLFYLPDQDPRKRQCVFAPFFGLPTATFASLGRLAALTDAAIVPLLCRQLPRGRGYEVYCKPPLAGFPTDDPLKDATCMNLAIEQAVREMPEQYFWMHKRFKSRPAGEADFYR